MGEKINICIVTASLMLGGGDKLIHSICSYLVKDDFDVVIFPSYPAPTKNTTSTKDLFTSIGVKVEDIPSYMVYYSKIIWIFQMIIETSLLICKNPKAIFSFQQLWICLKKSNQIVSTKINRYFNEITKNRIISYSKDHEINMLCGYHTATCETLYNLKNELKTPTIYTEITSPKSIYEENQNTLHTLKEQIDTYASFNKIYVPSDKIANEFMQYYHISENVTVMPFIDVFPRRERLLNISNNKVTKYGLMGRFSKEKNQVILIKILPDILKSVPEAELVLIGEGPDEKDLKEEAKKLGVQNSVKFIPPYNSILDVIDLIDIVVLLSDGEGMPLTLIESLYYGKPIIATDVGSISEMVINDKNGYLVNKNDYDVITRHIVSLMTDNRKYQQFSENSMNMYDLKYNPDKLYHQYRLELLSLITH